MIDIGQLEKCEPDPVPLAAVKADPLLGAPLAARAPFLANARDRVPGLAGLKVLRMRIGMLRAIAGAIVPADHARIEVYLAQGLQGVPKIAVGNCISLSKNSIK